MSMAKNFMRRVALTLALAFAAASVTVAAPEAALAADTSVDEPNPWIYIGGAVGVAVVIGVIYFATSETSADGLTAARSRPEDEVGASSASPDPAAEIDAAPWYAGDAGGLGLVLRW